MKIQVIVKATGTKPARSVCPWVLDVPPEQNR